MCGLGGVFFHPNTSLSPRRGQPAPPPIRALQHALAHRGPDGGGVFVDDGVALVHTRLALVDPEGGAQPLISADGAHVVVVNGEIYNHRDLRQRYAGAFPFRTHCDSEVVLAAVVVDGDAGLDALQGEFAIAWYDTRRRRGLLARDRLGVKPLVYAVEQHGGSHTLTFASEVQALLAAAPQRRRLDRERLAQALVCPAFSGEVVPFVDVESVPRGGRVVVDHSGVQVLAGPPIRRPGARRSRGNGDRAEALQEAFVHAVDTRLQLDAPLGAFLSGGFDSSAMVAAAARLGRRLPAFTLRFDDDATLSNPHRGRSIVVDDDGPVAAEVARTLELPHHLVDASTAAWLAALPKVWASQDRLVAWEQEVSQHLLAAGAAAHVKAVLVGDAADETHFGYGFLLDATVVGSPQKLLERFGAKTRASLLRDGDAVLRRRVAALRSERETDRDLDLDGDLAGEFDDVHRARDAATQIILDHWLPRLLHNGDIHTMACGLEARLPFADAAVVAIADTIHAADAFDGGQDHHGAPPEKAFLRRALATLVPAPARSRPKSALPRHEGLGRRYLAEVQALLSCPHDVEALAVTFDVDALRAYVARSQPEPHLDDETRSVLFSVLATAGFLHHHVTGPSPERHAHPRRHHS